MTKAQMEITEQAAPLRTAHLQRWIVYVATAVFVAAAVLFVYFTRDSPYRDLVLLLGLWGFLAIYLWIIAPIRGRFLLWFARPLRSKKFEPDDSVPAHISKRIQRITADLNEVGFSRVVSYRTDGGTGNFTHFSAEFENVRERCLAGMAVSCRGHPLEPVGTVGLVFQTSFRDGSKVGTLNQEMPGSLFPEEPSCLAVELPMPDPEMQFQVHAAVVRRHAATEDRIAVPTDPIAYRQAQDEENYARLMDAGYLFYDARDDVYRPTWKAAILMCWKNQWPVGAIRRSRKRRRTAALLKELEAAGELTWNFTP
jgi:hypothetical protein